jgi:hypothetical protein
VIDHLAGPVRSLTAHQKREYCDVVTEGSVVMRLIGACAGIGGVAVLKAMQGLDERHVSSERLRFLQDISRFLDEGGFGAVTWTICGICFSSSSDETTSIDKKLCRLQISLGLSG